MGNRPKKISKADHSILGLDGKISARKKWFLLRRHKDAGGPAAAACKSLADRHVYAVDIRPLFPVDFNRDKILVE